MLTSMALLLGLDIGTSATKAVLIDGRGRVVATAAAPHSISQPHPGWSEQDPEMWWDASVAATRAVTAAAAQRGVAASTTAVAERVEAIGLSGQMHGSVFLPAAARESGGTTRALRPALLWNDQRTADQCAALEAAVGGRRALVERVGNAALTGFTLPKILWLRAHEAAVFEHAATVVLPKDFVRYRHTGALATDVGDAAGTLLFDVDRRVWSDSMFAAVGLDRALLPHAHESAAVAGHVTPWAAPQTGLPVGTPVVAGSGDNMCGAIGAGAVERGIVLATLGTSGVIYAHSPAPHRDLLDPAAPGRLHTMCAATGTSSAPGEWCVTGCMLSAAGSLEWARRVLAPDVPYAALFAEAAQSPPGARGLVFLPYLTGERCPHPDPLARGGWIGLTSRHTRGDLVRAVLEGVTFAMRQMLDLVRAIGVPVEHVRLGGGGAKSAFWQQLQADIYDQPVDILDADEGPALGAALLAGVGRGVWPSVSAACRAAISVARTLAPATAAGHYAAPRAAFAALYEDLRARFAALAAFDSPQ